MKWRDSHSLSKQAIFLVILAAFSSLFWMNRFRTVRTPAIEVRLAVTRSESTGLVRLANQLGFFSSEGLNVKLVERDLSALSVEGLAGGGAEFAAVEDRTVVEGGIKGFPFLILGTIFSSNSSPLVVARADRGIVQPEALKGKRVGVARGVAYEYFASKFMWSFGVEAKNVRVVEMGAEELFAALKGGNVDAVSVREPHASELKHAMGDKVVIFGEREFYGAPKILVGNAAYVRAHPEVSHKLVKALVRAEDFARENRDAALNIVASNVDMDPNYLRVTWDDSQFVVRLDQALIVSLEQRARWLIKLNSGNLARAPNFFNFIYVSSLEKARPSSVGIIR